MLRSLGLTLAALALAVTGCRDNTTNPDMTTVLNDLTMNTSTGDMTCTTNCGGGMASIHDIDTGVVATGTPGVTISNVVVTGVVYVQGVSKSKHTCEYSAFVQDPNGPSPSAIKLFATGATGTLPDGGGTKYTCIEPGKGTTGSPFDSLTALLNIGDIVNVTGKTDAFVPSTDAGLSPSQHELDVTSITFVKSGGVIKPFAVTDATQFANNGQGFIDHEDEVVTITAAMPTAYPVPDSHGTYTWSGAQFNDTYRYYYDYLGPDAGTFPAAGQTFKSITGVAELDFGGEILPRTMADFTQ